MASHLRALRMFASRALSLIILLPLWALAGATTGPGGGVTGSTANIVNQLILPQVPVFAPSTLPGLYAWWSAAQFLGDTNGQVVATNWTDITGNWTATNILLFNSSPTYGANSMNEQPGVYFGPGGGSAKTIYEVTNFFTSMQTNLTIFCVARYMGYPDGSQALFTINTNIGTSGILVQPYKISLPPAARSGGIWLIQTAGLDVGDACTMGAYVCDIMVLRLSFVDATHYNYKSWLNGVPALDSQVTAGGIGGQNIPQAGITGAFGQLFFGSKNDTGVEGWNGYLGDLGFYTNALTDDQVNTLNQMLELKYHRRAPNVVLDGASWMVGAGTQVGSNILQLLHQAMPGINIEESAVGGMGSGAIYTNAALSWVNNRRNEAGKNIAVLMADTGFNDTNWLGLTVQQTETNWLNYANLLHSNGWQVDICSPISSEVIETNPGLSRSNWILWQSNNCQSGQGLFDAWVPLQLDPYIGTNGAYSNIVLYPDGDFLHPGITANASMVTNEFAPILNAQIYGTYSLTNPTNVPPMQNGWPWQTVYGGHIYYNSNESWQLMK
jgi:hypothetical protein